MPGQKYDLKPIWPPQLSETDLVTFAAHCAKRGYLDVARAALAGDWNEVLSGLFRLRGEALDNAHFVMVALDYHSRGYVLAVMDHVEGLSGRAESAVQALWNDARAQPRGA